MTIFNTEERGALLAVKGVGPTVIARLEQMGFGSFDALAEADAEVILAGGATLTGSSCWKNSPLARKAIQGAIACAQSWEEQSV